MDPLKSNSTAAQTAPGFSTFPTGLSVRSASRSNQHCSQTSGLAPSYLQANLIVLPSEFAADFRQLCQRNPVPCPLLAESTVPGAWDIVNSKVPGISGSQIVSDIDIRRDAPAYMVYKDAKLVKDGCRDIVEEWTENHVAFLIGCSFSFESALSNASLPPRHITMARNVPMYRTSMLLCPAGVFTGSTYVVSMRPYRQSEIEEVRRITRSYSATHGEPVAWGWDAMKTLGIRDIDSPQWGDNPLTKDGKPLGTRYGHDDEVPVFWGCGVTPQEAVMRAELPGIVMAHAPGHMILLDAKESDIMTMP